MVVNLEQIMIRKGATALLLLVLAGCQPPSERLRLHRQFRFVMKFHDELPGMTSEEIEAIHKIYKDAVRARLASVYGQPIEEAACEYCPEVQVNINNLEIAGYPTKGAVFKDWLVDSTVSGVLDKLTQNPEGEANQNGRNDSMVNRFIERRIEKSRLDRLGYRPFLVETSFEYRDSTRSYSTAFTGWELMPYMQPLKKISTQDQAWEIRREEGRALGEKIVSKLSDMSGWTVGPGLGTSKH